MARHDYIFLHWKNLIDKQCVKKLLSPTTVIFISFDTIIKSLYWCSEIAKQHQKWILHPPPPPPPQKKKVFIGALKLQNNIRNGFYNPQNPIIEVLYIILWQVDPKLIFSLVSWWPYWIYANNKNCPKVAQGQPCWNSSRTPKGYESAKKNVIGKNISRSPKFQIDYYTLDSAKNLVCLDLKFLTAPVALLAGFEPP